MLKKEEKNSLKALAFLNDYFGKQLISKKIISHKY
jgi:hypothetical protein